MCASESVWRVAGMQITEINESPVYMLMNPVIAPQSKDLPITLYESGALAPTRVVQSHERSGKRRQRLTY